MKKGDDRKICSLPEECLNARSRSSSVTGCGDFSTIIKQIDENVVGRDASFLGPYGRRKIVYCDYTASGRALEFIEDYVLKEVLPMYGNTHSSTNVTALQSTFFRNEAREIVQNAAHISKDDAVIFTGNGCMGALRKLIQLLDFKVPPIIFVGSCEHHSIILPWKDIGAKIIQVGETKEGFLDLMDLENKLKQQIEILRAEKMAVPVRFIGCFSAASPITGILADDIATTMLLHQYNALVFWDYATAAPYVQLDMNPLVPGTDASVHKDAIFFSGHKFIGGVQSSGVLIAKKKLLNCGILDTYETEDTSAITETIRMGLAMHLKQSVGPSDIIAREQQITKMVLSFFTTIPEIILLGNASIIAKRLTVYSFLVKHPRGVFLHHNFVCAILNDMFGIQARGGCACSGSYTRDLLGIGENLANSFKDLLSEDSLSTCRCTTMKEGSTCYEILRPGFSRISLPYFISDSEITFVLEAVKMVATEGWKLLPQYAFHPETGDWKHRTIPMYRDRKWLSSICFVDGKITSTERKISGHSPFPHDSIECLRMARNVFSKGRKIAHRSPISENTVLINQEIDALRWFMLPSEAENLLTGKFKCVKTQLPFCPPGKYTGFTTNEELEPSSSYLAAVNMQTNFVKSLSQCSDEPPYLVNANPGILNAQMKRSCSLSVDAIQGPCSCEGVVASSLSYASQVNPVPRNRCRSLESSSCAPPPPPSIQKNFVSHCSCGSQTNITDLESNGSGSPDDRIKRLFRYSESDRVEAYVKEVTEELAAEIKTEIRGVIATVDNALQESAEYLSGGRRANGFICRNIRPKVEAVPMSPPPPPPPLPAPPLQPQPVLHMIPSPLFFPSYSQCCNIGVMPQAAAGCNHNPVCLAELTNDVVTDLRSELREMVNAVDEVISPSVGLATPTYVQGGTIDDSKTLRMSFADDLDQITPDEQEECQKMCGKCRIVCQNKVLVAEEPARQNITSASIHQNQGDLGQEQGSAPLSSGAESNICDIPPKWQCPPKCLWKPMMEAISEFGMIKNGDRILICLSGGRDSLSLLHTMHQYQFFSGAFGLNFTLAALTLDPGNSTYSPGPLIPYLQSLGIRYLHETRKSDSAGELHCSSICTYCSRLKQNRLHETALNFGYNVLALGQHMDDFVESFLLSVFRNGRMQSMKAKFHVKNGNLRVIRPFIYVRDKHVKQFVELSKLPIIKGNCMNCGDVTKDRRRVKQLMTQQEMVHSKLFENLRKVMRPLIEPDYNTEAYQVQAAMVDKIPVATLPPPSFQETSVAQESINSPEIRDSGCEMVQEFNKHVEKDVVCEGTDVFEMCDSLIEVGATPNEEDVDIECIRGEANLVDEPVVKEVENKSVVFEKDDSGDGEE